MALQSSGPISIGNLRSEFGGSGSTSLSEFYRGSTYTKKVSGNNTSVPTSGTISLDDFHGAEEMRYVTYDIQAGGGAGGGGWDDRGDYWGIANAGGASTFVYGNTLSVTASGGAGGGHGYGGRANPGTAGGSSFYGSGGAGGARNSYGSDAPSSHYGAGGGGGGGDNSSTFDRSGAAGTGGSAGQRKTGNVYVTPNASVSWTVGARGNGRDYGNYKGGHGAAGIVKITKDGVSIVSTQSNGSTTIT